MLPESPDRLEKTTRPGAIAWLSAMLIVLAGCAPAGHQTDAGVAAADPAAADLVTDSRAPERPEEAEHWYRLDVDGTPAGWMLNRETVRGDKLTTVSRLHLRFQRADTAQTLEIDSRFVETLDGRPLSAWSRQKLGPTPIETTWKFLRHEVLVDTVHGESSRRQRVALPAGEWLTPGQVQPHLSRLLADGARHFTLSSLDPQIGLEIIDTEWILDAEDETLRILDAEVSTLRFRQRSTFIPELESVTHVNADGLTVRSTTPMMGITMTSTLVRRDQALEDSDGPELLARTFLYPDRPIRSPRDVRRARYAIRRAGTDDRRDQALRLPSAGAQRVEKTVRLPAAEGSGEVVHLRVEVASDPSSAVQPGPAASPGRAELELYLRASTFVDYRSAGVQRLLAEALPEGSPATAAEKAEILRAFVAGYLRDKNLDSILATASETAASRSGDCTEHSVLLIALLRAAGVPARAVTGLIYVEEFAGERDLFGYHMWAQAWTGDRWLDLDATLAVSFDAAHIAIGTTALADDQATLRELARLAAFMGQASIRVLEAH